MLQLPAYREATERKSLLSNQEIKKFITSQQQAKTVKKTTYYDMNVFKRFLNECCQKTKSHGNTPRRAGYAAVQFSYNYKEKGQFKISAKMTQCPPSSRSLQRFLDENNAKVNNLKDEEFKVSEEVPKCKRWEIRKQGKGTKPNATVALTNEKKKTSLASMSLKYFRVRYGFF